ncbi:hypothetical protein ARAM_001185 [Aspergillus rambellii]|uniref:GPI anchored protein n=1 Tax=Aspergillus rambellii TaxID=308745 RepID=A0A0F8W4K3_9EURO|nr:hypothetical protein ARAM_001185 [Aspergillus rambellii]
MMLKIALLPALACIAYAESTVTSMFIYGADNQPLAASIVGNDATATTYSINCPPGTDSSDCGMGPGLTLIAGPGATTTYKMDDGDEFYMTAVCSVGTEVAVCTDSMGGTGANFPGQHTSTADVDLLPVTVTAGSITSGDQPATTTAATTSTGTASSPAVATTMASSTAHVSASAVKTSGSTSTSTGGVAQITGNAGIVIGGAAMALLGAVL